MKRINLIVLLIFLLSLLIACATQTYPTDGMVTVTTATQATTSLELPLPQLTIEQAQEVVLQGENLEANIDFLMSGELDFEQPEQIFNGVEGYLRVSSATGFSSIADIQKALLRYYTEEMVDRLMMGNDGGLYSLDFPMYVEIDGNLYFRRPMGYPTRLVWEEAVFTLLESDGERSIYRVVVREYDSEVSHVTYEVTFVGDRIHNRQWISVDVII